MIPSIKTMVVWTHIKNGIICDESTFAFWGGNRIFSFRNCFFACLCNAILIYEAHFNYQIRNVRIK